MLDAFKYLDVKKNEIIAKYKCYIDINIRDYKLEEILETSEHYIIPGIFDIVIPEFNDSVSIILNYRVHILKTSNMDEDTNVIRIFYEPGDKIVWQENYIVQSDIGFIIRLLEGRAKYIPANPIMLLNLLNMHLTDPDLVHLELIISNMFRTKDNNRIRCREVGNYKNTVIVGQTNQPFTDSWLSAMAFQYIKKGLQTGIVSNSEIQNNPIEQVINNKFNTL